MIISYIPFMDAVIFDLFLGPLSSVMTAREALQVIDYNDKLKSYIVKLYNKPYLIRLRDAPIWLNIPSKVWRKCYEAKNGL
jgi:hypothetical protein